MPWSSSGDTGSAPLLGHSSPDDSTHEVPEIRRVCPEREGIVMPEPATSRPGRWQRSRVAARVEQRTAGSRLLYRVDHYSSLPVVAVAAGASLVCALAIGIALGFPNGWVVAFESGTSAVTLAMVFVIQHTQSREQAATQRKLDELLRALPGAESGLIMLEEASEETMTEVEEGQRDFKRSQR